MTDKKYSIIYADPPWNYNDKNCNGAIGRHYIGPDLADLQRLPIKEIADSSAVLFMWVTYPFLPQGLELMKAWGFTYKSIAFQWLKLNRKSKTPFYGLGRWTRGNTECCLLATRGKPKRISNSVFQLIQQPITRHSEKPQEVRDKILQLMGDLPRIELFARKKTEGWDVWGNEVESDIALGSVGG